MVASILKIGISRKLMPIVTRWSVFQNQVTFTKIHYTTIATREAVIYSD